MSWQAQWIGKWPLGQNLPMKTWCGGCRRTRHMARCPRIRAYLYVFGSAMFGTLEAALRLNAAALHAGEPGALPSLLEICCSFVSTMVGLLYKCRNSNSHRPSFRCLRRTHRVKWTNHSPRFNLMSRRRLPAIQARAFHQQSLRPALRAGTFPSFTTRGDAVDRSNTPSWLRWMD